MHVRDAIPEDSPAIAGLLGELGYPTTAEEARTRLARLEAGAGDRVFVAEVAGRVVGLASLHWMPVLHREPPVGRLTALVVGAAARGQGVGRALVEHAARAARAAGCDHLEVTCNLRRTEAHAFYRRLGFEPNAYRFLWPLE